MYCFSITSISIWYSFTFPYQFRLRKLGASPCSPVPPCVQMRKGSIIIIFARGITVSINMHQSSFQQMGLDFININKEKRK